MIPLTQAEIVEAMTFPDLYAYIPLDEGAGTQTITYAFTNSLSEPGVTNMNWTAAYQALSLEVLADFERVLDVDFTPGSSTRHVDFGLASDISGSTVGLGGYWFSYYSNGTVADYQGWTAVEDLSDQQYREVFAHELGHALGLRHSFDSPDIPPSFEHEGFSIMSYTGDPGPTFEAAGYSGGWNILQRDELAILDIVALQDIWGARLDHNIGDTIYGTVGTALPRTLVDGGGTDTIDLGDWSTTRMDAFIDLGRGGLSEVGRDTAGTPDFLRFAIDYNSDIEHVVAPATPTTLVTGNALSNSITASELFGRGGVAAADEFLGLGGEDTLSGYIGDDTLSGGSEDDVILGGADDDVLMGGSGSDSLEGGTGNDILGGDAMDWDDLVAIFAAEGIVIA